MPPSPEPSTSPTRGRGPCQRERITPTALPSSEALRAAAARLNASGSSSPSVTVRRRRSGSHRWTRACGVPNSASRWRQPPQGVQSAGPSAITSASVIRRSPAATSAARALVSAQLPSG